MRDSMLTEVTTVVRPFYTREIIKCRIAFVLMCAMGGSFIDTFETFKARNALTPKGYARVLRDMRLRDIVLEYGFEHVKELLKELLTEHLAREMEETSHYLGHYLDRRGRALSQPRDAATGRFV